MLDDVVDSFYASALDDGLFLEATSRAVERFGAVAGGYYRKTNDSRDLLDVLFVGLEQRWIDRWQELMAGAETLGRWAHNPNIGAVVNIDRHVSVEGDPLYERWVRPQGLHWSTGVLVDIDADSHGAFIVMRRAEQPRFDEEADQAMAELGRHVVRIMRMRHDVRRLDGQLAFAHAMLDRLQAAAIVTDGVGRILKMNEAADELIRARRGLGERKGRLCGEEHLAHDRLQHALASVVGTGAADVVVIRSNGGRPLTLEIEPIPAPTRAPSQPAFVALVLVNDPMRSPAVSLEHVQDLYDLTAAEARVALAVLEHDKLQSIADTLGRSLGTVRAQLAQVLAKTGTRRQAELVRLLMAHGRRQ